MEEENLRKVSARVLTSSLIKSYQATRDEYGISDWDRVDLDEVYDSWAEEATLVDSSISCDKWTKVRNISSVYKELYRSQKKDNPANFCDVHLIGTDGVVPVHRGFLEQVSPFAKSLIQDTLEFTRGGVMAITVAGVTTAQLTALMTMLYVGKVVFDQNDEKVAQLKALLKMFGVDNLEEVITEEIVDEDHALYNKRRRSIRSIWNSESQIQVQNQAPGTAANDPDLVTGQHVVVESQATTGNSSGVPAPNPDANENPGATAIMAAEPLQGTSRSALAELPEASTSMASTSLLSTIPHFTKVPPGTLTKKSQAPRIKRRVPAEPVRFSRRNRAKRGRQVETTSDQQTSETMSTTENVPVETNSVAVAIDDTPGPSSAMTNPPAPVNNGTSANSTCSYLPMEFTKVPPGTFTKSKQPRLKRPILEEDSNEPANPGIIQANVRNPSSDNNSEGVAAEEPENIPKSRYERDNDFVPSPSDGPKSNSNTDRDEDEDEVIEDDLDSETCPSTRMTRARRKSIDKHPEYALRRYATRRSKFLNSIVEKSGHAQGTEKAKAKDPSNVAKPPQASTSKKAVSSLTAPTVPDPPLDRAKGTKRKTKEDNDVEKVHVFKCPFCKTLVSSEGALDDHLRKECDRAKHLKNHFDLPLRVCNTCRRSFPSMSADVFLRHVDSCGRREGLRSRKPPPTSSSLPKMPHNPRRGGDYGDGRNSARSSFRWGMARNLFVEDVNLSPSAVAEIKRQLKGNPDAFAGPRPRLPEGRAYIFNGEPSTSGVQQNQESDLGLIQPPVATEVQPPSSSAAQPPASTAVLPPNAGTSQSEQSIPVPIGNVTKKPPVDAATAPDGESNPSRPLVTKKSKCTNKNKKADSIPARDLARGVGAITRSTKLKLVGKPQPGTSKGGTVDSTPMVATFKKHVSRCGKFGQGKERPKIVVEYGSQEGSTDPGDEDTSGCGVQEMDVESVSRAVSALVVPNNVGDDSAASTSKTASTKENDNLATEPESVAEAAVVLNGATGSEAVASGVVVEANVATGPEAVAVGAAVEANVATGPEAVAGADVQDNVATGTEAVALPDVEDNESTVPEAVAGADVENQKGDGDVEESEELPAQTVATESGELADMETSQKEQSSSLADEQLVVDDEQMEVDNEEQMDGSDDSDDEQRAVVNESVDQSVEAVYSTDSQNQSKAADEGAPDPVVSTPQATQSQARTIPAEQQKSPWAHQVAHIIKKRMNRSVEKNISPDKVNTEIPVASKDTASTSNDSPPVNAESLQTTSNTQAPISEQNDPPLKYDKDRILLMLKTYADKFAIQRRAKRAKKLRLDDEAATSETKTSSDSDSSSAVSGNEIVNASEENLKETRKPSSDATRTRNSGLETPDEHFAVTPPMLPQTFFRPRSSVAATAIRSTAFRSPAILPPAPLNMRGPVLQTARRSVTPRSAMAKGSQIASASLALPETRVATTVAPTPVAAPALAYTLAAAPTPVALPTPVAAPEPVAVPSPVALPTPVATPEPVAVPSPVAVPTRVAAPALAVVSAVNRAEVVNASAAYGPVVDVGSFASFGFQIGELGRTPVTRSTAELIALWNEVPSYPRPAPVHRNPPEVYRVCAMPHSTGRDRINGIGSPTPNQGTGLQSNGQDRASIPTPTHLVGDETTSSCLSSLPPIPVLTTSERVLYPNIARVLDRQRMSRELAESTPNRLFQSQFLQSALGGVPPIPDGAGLYPIPNARSNPFRDNQIGGMILAQGNSQRILVPHSTLPMPALDGPRQQYPSGSYMSGPQVASSSPHRSTSSLSQTVSVARRRRSGLPDYRVMGEQEIQFYFQALAERNIVGLSGNEVTTFHNNEHRPAILPPSSNSGADGNNEDGDDISVVPQVMTPSTSDSATRSGGQGITNLPAVKKEKLFKGPGDKYIMEYREGPISCPRCGLKFQTTSALLVHRKEMCI